ncbi:hypothetical protein HD806DRAFT_491284 [Xylariaceae sp. AK1471]|nr:hypothetical protein HD806DRAFT_491284 [Xylariaceae sp. AK1471]
MSWMDMIPKVFNFRVSEPENSIRLGSWNYDRKKTRSTRHWLLSLEILTWIESLLCMISVLILVIEWDSSQPIARNYSIILISAIKIFLYFDDLAYIERFERNNPFQDRRVSVTTHVHLGLVLGLCFVVVYGLSGSNLSRWAVFVLLVVHITDSCACVIWANVRSNDHASDMPDRILSSANDQDDDDLLPGLINESWLSQRTDQETTPLLLTDSSFVHGSNNNQTCNVGETQILQPANSLQSDLAEDTSRNQEFSAEIHSSIWYIKPYTGFPSVFTYLGPLICILSAPQIVCNTLILYDHPAAASDFSFMISSILTSFGGLTWVASYYIIISLRVPLNRQFVSRLTFLDSLAIQTVVLAIVILFMTALRASHLSASDPLAVVPFLCSFWTGVLLLLGFKPLSKDSHQVFRRFTFSWPFQVPEAWE